jgi:RNA polymerase sigma-70 factor (ECF subfamily)
MDNLHIPGTRLSLIDLLQGSTDDTKMNQARDELFTAYHPVVLRWCQRCGLQPVDAEDVSQDLFLRLFKAIKSYVPPPSRPPGGSFRCWLKTVVLHEVIDFWRGPNRRVNLLDNERLQSLCSNDSLSILHDGLVDAWDPERQEEVKEIVARVKARVKPHTWDAFERVVLGRQTAAEAAKDLGISEISVYVAVSRIKQKLRQERDKLRDNENE